MSLFRSRFAAAFEAQEAAEKAAAELQRSKVAFERRQSSRLEHAEVADMILRGAVAPISLLNISENGLAVRVLRGTLPDADEPVRIRLCDGRRLHGNTAWISHDCFGLKFDLSLENVSDIIHFETRGETLYRGISRRPKID